MTELVKRLERENAEHFSTFREITRIVHFEGCEKLPLVDQVKYWVHRAQELEVERSRCGLEWAKRVKALEEEVAKHALREAPLR